MAETYFKNEVEKFQYFQYGNDIYSHLNAMRAKLDFK